jgi:hypothetical protein
MIQMCTKRGIARRGSRSEILAHSTQYSSATGHCLVLIPVSKRNRGSSTRFRICPPSGSVDFTVVVLVGRRSNEERN